MVWVCESCCGAVCFWPWEGDVEVGEDESLDGGEPVENESAAAGVGGVQVGEGGQHGACGGDRVASFGQQAR